MENIDKLKIRRRAIKASCTRVETYVNSIRDMNNDACVQLQLRRDKLELCWNSYDEVQSQIELLEPNPETNDREVFEAVYFDLMTRLRNLIEGFQGNQNSQQISVSNIGNSQQRSHENSRMKLPRLNLPVFSGKYQEWTPFSQMFRTTITENNGLTDIEKFQYLRTSLADDAADAIESLDISAENFAIAWHILEKRYDRIRVIVQSHIQAILEIPPIKKENYLELKNLVNVTIKHTNSLKSLKRPVASWDDLIIHILGNKLDPVTFRDWENTLSSDELPNINQLLEFLLKKCQTLESLISKDNASTSNSKNNSSTSRKSSINCAASVNLKCNFCDKNHLIYYCQAFLKLSIQRRIEEIKKRKLCINCLKSKTHMAAQCTSGTCKTCNLKHNTLLHLNKQNSAKADTKSELQADNISVSAGSETIVTHNMSNFNENYVMLSTALVNAFDVNGSKVPCRVLLDSGSQANLITREFLSQLKVKTKQHNISIVGINRMVSNANDMAIIKIQSRVNKFQTTIECIVTEKITDSIPMMHIRKRCINIPKNIKLADPQFNVPSTIQVLLGADIFWQLMCIGQIKSSAKNPTIQKTHLGWIMAGSINNKCLLRNGSKASVNSCLLSTDSPNNKLEQAITRFWTIEHELSNQAIPSPNERKCEEHFLRTVKRNSEGRFIVTLPIKGGGLQQLGSSRSTALQRLHQVEKRFKFNDQLKIDYTRFMREYLELGHMQLSGGANNNNDKTIFYLPHHCVFKETSTTTKLRVVFDGSCKSSTGTSLNDILMIGPVVQSDLITLLARFRTFKYVFTADIVKMYRQILVDNKQTSLQCILWRENSTESVSAYELKTVTYGTASASYLATRCLKYLAELYQNEFPIGSRSIINDFYVDDLLTGAHSLADAKIKRDQIMDILSKGCFVLDKWFSNTNEILEGVSKNVERSCVLIDEKHEARILGLQWNPHEDSFRYTFNSEGLHSGVTKRSILSETSRLFDPLGLIGPVILSAKLMIQELWKLNIDWDATVPMNIHSRWLRYKSQMSGLSKLRIPRMIGFTTDALEVQFHGFSDASQFAYGACCYIRVHDIQKGIQVHLLASKSRVAPAKSTSLPRLELCAALLLSQLQIKLLNSIDIQPNKIFLWTDSTITLSWIRAYSRKFEVFVANRVGEIQRLTNVNDWHHVATDFNPADIISRGASPEELINSNLWWNGPKWLGLEERDWPKFQTQYPERLPEQLKVNTHIIKRQSNILEKLIVKYSNFDKLIRVLAYIFRFLNNCTPTLEKCVDTINSQEYEHALHVLCKYVQQQYFSQEIHHLKNSLVVPNTSKILSLNPFLDKDGVLRVGGRLKNAAMSYDTKHPILLPKEHTITKLIISNEHRKNLHAGIQATIYAVRLRFWPISAKVTTRNIIKRCITCFRFKPVTPEAIMSELPGSRVSPSHPFAHCGLDFGGPFYIREHKRRKAKLIKVYICIFICFSTKAVHMELVADLSSEAFLGLLKRFMARRGKISCLYSDNGTNFVGTARELNDLHRVFVEEQSKLKLNDFFVEAQIQWQNIPPNAPHFGGLWEAAIKSAKYHMKRIIGNTSLNYDEMSTIIAEIEAILNSRPISPMSEDPNDLHPLTPAHFLIGKPLNSYTQPNIEDIRINRLTRWQMIEQLRQHFWQRWRVEYLNNLQGRTKWRFCKGEYLKPGQLVVIQQSGLAPLQWLLGRVVDVNVSADGKVRSAKVRTRNGIIARPLTKLAVLPLDV